MLNDTLLLDISQCNKKIMKTFYAKQNKNIFREAIIKPVS